jgi:hypothetical protein
MVHHAWRAASFFLSFGACGSAAAQSTWIVDAANGPGAHFTTLAPAIAAAQEGDLVLVRAGTYRPVTVSKGLRLVGEPGAEIRSQANTEVMRFENLAAGRVLHVSGFRFTDGSVWNLPVSAVVVSRCAGRVHLEGLQLLYGWQHFALVIEHCASVTVNQCSAEPGVSISTSYATFTECVLHGRSTNAGAIAQGVSAYASTVELVQCDVKGSNGSGHAPAYQGVRADYATIVVRGDAQSRIAGGLFGGTVPAPAIADPYWHQSHLVLDPTVTLVGGVDGFASQTLRRLPALRASGGALGGTLTLALGSPAGEPFLVLGSLPALPTPLPPLGDLLIDPALFFVVASGTQGVSEQTVFPRAIPAGEELRGWALAYQALSAPTAGIEFSNAATVVLH